jgi:hypothetical protein
MHYNWTFSLKSLGFEHILGALCLFHAAAAAGALAQCFYSNCNTKLFSTAIVEYLLDNNSKVIMAPAKHQSSNGLVESHWKTMVHMASAYLTEKQMPHSYWFFAITNAAWIMNAIPGKFRDRLALPFLLVHGVGHDEWTWKPMFSSPAYIMKKAAMIPGLNLNIWLTQWMVDVLPLQTLLWYSILRMANIMSQTATGLIRIVSLAWSILCSNTTGVSSAHCYESIIRPLKRSILSGQGLNGSIHPRISSLWGWSWIFPSQFLLPKPTCCSLTPSSSAMARLLLYHSMKWPVSSLHRLWRFAIWTCMTLSCPRYST